MAEISKITLPSGTTYDIKDTTARSMAGGGIQLKGTTTTALTDEATTNPITINGESYTAVNQDAVFYGKKEFVFDGTKWHEFGDMSGLGDLATKDSVSATYTPAGSVSTPTITVTPSTTTKYVASSSSGGGSASKETVTVSKASSGTTTYTPQGSISVGTGTANYTPAGSVGTPTITVTPSTVTKYVAGSSSGGGSVTAGSAASFTATVSNETLTLGWTANTPTAVTLPTFSSQTIATGISSASSTQPSFTGTGAELKFTGTGARLVTDSQVYTSVTMPSFSSQTIATGISSASSTQPSFTGTEATITST